MQRFLYFLDQNRKHVEARNQIENRYPADFAVLWWKCQKQPPEVFYKKAVLKNFAIFPVTHLHLQSLFIKKRFQHSCFPVKFTKFLKIPFLQNTPGDCFCAFWPINPFKVNVAMQQTSIYWFLCDGNINPKWVSNKLLNTFLRLRCVETL